MIILGVDPGLYGGESGFALIEADLGRPFGMLQTWYRPIPGYPGVPNRIALPKPDVIVIERPPFFTGKPGKDDPEGRLAKRAKSVALVSMSVGWITCDCSHKFLDAPVILQLPIQTRREFGMASGATAVGLRSQAETLLGRTLPSKGAWVVNQHEVDAILTACAHWYRVMNEENVTRQVDELAMEVGT